MGHAKGTSTYVIALFLSVISLSGSAAQAQTYWKDFLPPSDQAAERDQKSLGIGLPISEPYNMPGQVQLRLGQSFALGLSYDSQTIQNDYHSPRLSHDREMEATIHRSTAYFQIYPTKGGFYFGAGAEHRSGTYTILKPEDSPANIYDPDMVEELTGEYSAIYGGPSFGWTWIWKSGVTLGFDVSKRKRFVHENKVLTGASEYQEELEAEAIEEVIPESVNGTIMFGYSF